MDVVDVCVFFSSVLYFFVSALLALQKMLTNPQLILSSHERNNANNFYEITVKSVKKQCAI